jgi:hypothetical protein
VLLLVLWGLLVSLGDERGADVARIFAIGAGGTGLLLQFLLVNLLALSLLRTKIDRAAVHNA